MLFFICEGGSGTCWLVPLLYAAGFWYDLQAALLEERLFSKKLPVRSQPAVLISFSNILNILSQAIGAA